MYRLFAMTVLCVCGWACRLDADPLYFSATGCGPYKPEEEPLLEQYVNLVNQDRKSEFLVHLGDVVSGSKKKWPESQYVRVAGILQKSKVPVLVVLGDNEWNDLDNPAEGLAFWDRHFRDFDKHFAHAPPLDKQALRTENFAFVSHGVLVIGLNLVGGRVHDTDEWKVRMQHDADWVQAQFSKHAASARAAVLLAQAKPTKDHELFFRPLTERCLEWKKPVLYLHADGHVWEVEQAWRTPNLWRVQTDQVGRNPPVLVTVTDDAQAPFKFDRRITKPDQPQ